MKKKVVGMIMAAAMLAGIMAGCGNNAAENNSTAVNSDNAEGDKVQDQSAEQTGGQEIVVWTQMMDNEAALLQKYADQWAAETVNTVSVISQQAVHIIYGC